MDLAKHSHCSASRREFFQRRDARFQYLIIIARMGLGDVPMALQFTAIVD